MSLKDNFNQAVKDFLKKDGMVGDDPFKGSVNTTQEEPSRSQNSYGTSYSDTLRAAASSYRQDPFAENDFDAPEDTRAGTYVPPRQPSGGYTPPTGNSFRGGRPPETPYYETEETTIISRNTRISGDISSFANVNVEGSVQGDIRLTKNISVSGKVVGNIECNKTRTGYRQQCRYGRRSDAGLHHLQGTGADGSRQCSAGQYRHPVP